MPTSCHNSLMNIARSFSHKMGEAFHQAVIPLHRALFSIKFNGLLLAALVFFFQGQIVHAAGTLLFKSNFSSGVSTSNVYDGTGGGGRLTGVDQETGFDWGDWSDNPLFASTNFQYVALDPYQDWVSTRKVSSFQGRSNVLLMEVKGNAPRSSRTRNEMMFKPYSSNNFKVYMRYWMYLPANYVDNIDLSQESHNNILESKQKRLSGYTNNNGSWRFNIFIDQDGTTPYWRLKMEHQDVSTGNSIREGSILSNRNVPVPLGRWFLVEHFFKQHATDGRVRYSIDGKVVFDFKGRTQHPTEPKRVDFISPFKNYRGNGHQYPFAQYYDDIEIWSDLPDTNSGETQTTPAAPTGVAINLR